MDLDIVGRKAVRLKRLSRPMIGMGTAHIAGRIGSNGNPPNGFAGWLQTFQFNHIGSSLVEESHKLRDPQGNDLSREKIVVMSSN